MPSGSQNRIVRKQKPRRQKRGGRSSADSVGKYASDAWSLAKRTAYGLNEIRKLINIETKVLQTVNSGTISTSGTISPISSVAQGTDYNQRIGDSIKLQRIEVHIRAVIGTTATNSFLRILLIRDLDNYGTRPTVADVLETVDVLAPKKYLNSDRFSVIYDDLETLNTSNSNSVTEIITPHEGHIKYLGTTAADASNGKGSMYILWLSNEAAGTTAVQVWFDSRLYFTDD